MQKPEFKLSIKSPCPKKWGELVGDSKKRYCSQCEKQVFNGETLTQIEVTDMVREGQGTTCIRLVTDTAGNILYKDSSKKTKPTSIVRRAGLAIAAGGLVAACSSQPEQTPPPAVKPIAASEQAGMPIQGTFELEPIGILEEELGEIGENVMGDIPIDEALPDFPSLQEELEVRQMLGRVIMTKTPPKLDEPSKPILDPQTDEKPSVPHELLGTPGPPPAPPKTVD